MTRALLFNKQRFGEAHLKTAYALNELATLYLDQGNYGQAEPLFQQAITIFEENLGAEHPNTTGCVKRLALLYIPQGKYKQAEELIFRTLFIHG